MTDQYGQASTAEHSKIMLPPLAPNCDARLRPAPVILSTDLPPDLEFEPVVHIPKKGMKFTADKQRMFINALAACGSVTTSAAAVSMSTGQVYHLRNRPGCESFAAAWNKAVERGARRVLDILVDHAINGIPEYVFKDGQLVAERRRFDTRAQMWIVAHHMPEKFAVHGGLMHQPGSEAYMLAMKQKWRREWYQEQQLTADPEKARAEIRKYVAAVRGAKEREIANDPAKRAAYELLYGPIEGLEAERGGEA